MDSIEKEQLIEARDYLKKLLLSINRVKLESFLSEFTEKFGIKCLINDLIFPSLQSIGKLWENGNLALSQVYMAGRLCEETVPHLFKEKKEISRDFPKIGIVNLEDHHPFGTQLLEIFLKTRNINPILYPEGITVEELYDKIIDDKIEILLISTLMLRSALKIKNLSQKLKKSNKHVKIIVGGAPFTFDPELWKKVDADAMGMNPFDILELITHQMEEEK
ncbi:MAG: 5-methyltetrahydrofolate--homocysteinemethyltrans ferase [Promethearchaeota archaeon]|nr:MAG: 5-methyltetrahydrofolate--homocysteinemethyltrans ferase [Candidatus Lokiarchaeota archaeon]